ncbi:MAG TPA: archaemetzincin family Zn-dependent metalloprotease [Polyangia bacterium]|jgi:archaemetzincin
MSGGGAIVIEWIGTGNGVAQLLGDVRLHVEEVFELPARVTVPAARPMDAYDPVRRQDLSTATLRWIVDHTPHDAVKVLGITDHDLFISVLTYVFGQAQVGGRAAVVSTARLHQDLGGLTADERLFRARLRKECVHELGHTFGLTHCETRTCVMSRSNTIADVDAKGGLCRDCSALLRELRAKENL